MTYQKLSSYGKIKFKQILALVLKKKNNLDPPQKLFIGKFFKNMANCLVCGKYCGDWVPKIQILGMGWVGFVSEIHGYFRVGYP